MCGICFIGWYISGQHGGCRWHGAYLAPCHLQSSWWRCPVDRPSSVGISPDPGYRTLFGICQTGVRRFNFRLKWVNWGLNREPDQSILLVNNQPRESFDLGCTERRAWRSNDFSVVKWLISVSNHRNLDCSLAGSCYQQRKHRSQELLNDCDRWIQFTKDQ